MLTNPSCWYSPVNPYPLAEGPVEVVTTPLRYTQGRLQIVGLGKGHYSDLVGQLADKKGFKDMRVD